METTQDQPQLNKDNNPTVIQLQTIVIVNTTVVNGEHCTNGATTNSGETMASSDDIFASNYNLFTGDTNKKCNTFLSCKKFAYILAIILTICVISVLFLSPIISYIKRDTYNLESDDETQMVRHNISIIHYTTFACQSTRVLCHYIILYFVLATFIKITVLYWSSPLTQYVSAGGVHDVISFYNSQVAIWV